MTHHPTIDKASVIEAPLHSFEQCHADILAGLQSLRELPDLVAAAKRAQAIASDTLELFAKSILVHHGDEERELFPAVLADASPGDEHQAVQTMVRHLQDEHRAIEAAWKSLRSEMQAAAAGKPARLDAQAVNEFVLAYQAHVRHEEQEFLPLAAKILSRKEHHLDALGLSLLLRHTPMPVGYV